MPAKEDDFPSRVDVYSLDRSCSLILIHACNSPDPIANLFQCLQKILSCIYRICRSQQGLLSSAVPQCNHRKLILVVDRVLRIIRLLGREDTLLRDYAGLWGLCDNSSRISLGMIEVRKKCSSGLVNQLLCPTCNVTHAAA